VEPHRGAAARAQVALEGERAEALPQRLHAEGPRGRAGAKGGRDDGYEPDADLRDFENVPLKDDIDAYFEREVRPHVPDAWMDRTKDKVGYEINFNRHFYKYTPPARPLEEIDAELKQAEEEIMRLLREVTEAASRIRRCSCALTQRSRLPMRVPPLCPAILSFQSVRASEKSWLSRRSWLARTSHRAPLASQSTAQQSRASSSGHYGPQ
jgi:hypothetical protein